jgi:hypothetical protein
MSEFLDIVHHLKIVHHNILEARSASMFRWICLGIETSSDRPTRVRSLPSPFYQMIDADPTFETPLDFQPEMKAVSKISHTTVTVCPRYNPLKLK